MSTDDLNANEHGIPIAKWVMTHGHERGEELQQSIAAASAQFGWRKSTLHRKVAEVHAMRGIPSGNGNGPAKDADRLLIVHASDVQSVPVDWLWNGYIARGEVSMIVGDPGQGKSGIACDMAARVSAGLPWPDHIGIAGRIRGDLGVSIAEQGHVVILTLEDGLASTMRPRLDEAGADVGRIDFVEGVLEGNQAQGDIPAAFNLLQHTELLEKYICETGAVLAILDPLDAILGGINSFVGPEVRQVLTPLVKMAERTNCATVVIHHPNKNSDAQALYRAGGSIGFVAAARVIHVVAPDPFDMTLPVNKRRRIFVPLKFNHGEFPAGLGYELTGAGLDNKVLKIVWNFSIPVEASAQDALSPSKQRSDTPEMAKAKAFLKEMLGDGQRVNSNDLTEQALLLGITENTLKKARAVLKVKSGKQGMTGGWMCWIEGQNE